MATSQAEQPDKKKRSYISWTDEKKFQVALLASKYEAYKKSDRSMEDKWKEVLKRCLEKPVFSDWISDPPTWSSLQTALSRWTAESEKKYGISEEGANLSGLSGCPETADEFTKLILSMAEDRDRSKEEKAKEKEAEQVKKAAIFTHETAQLNLQGKLRNSDALAINVDTPSHAHLIFIVMLGTAAVVRQNRELTRRATIRFNGYRICRTMTRRSSISPFKNEKNHWSLQKS